MFGKLLKAPKERVLYLAYKLHIFNNYTRISVIQSMHFYACPYCDACPKSHLEMIKVDDLDCKYEKEEVCEEKHKCKEVMKCKKCKSEFVPNKKFIKDQKRKIKDG